MSDKRFLILSGPETEVKSIQLQAGTNLIGRWDPATGSFPEVDLEALDSESKTSRRHAVITVSDEGIMTLEDLGSLNGTFLSGKRVDVGRVLKIAVGDEILFASVKAKVVNSI